MFQISSFKSICTDSTEILFSQILLIFFSKLGSAGLIYHLSKLSFFTDPYCAGVSNKYCLLSFFIAAKPQIDEHASSPESMIVQEDETLAIWCNVSGTPAPEVTWFRLLGQDDPPVGKGTRVGKHRV